MHQINRLHIQPNEQKYISNQMKKNSIQPNEANNPNNENHNNNNNINNNNIFFMDTYLGIVINRFRIILCNIKFIKLSI